MFSLPPSGGGEGTSDDNPIILHGENADEFRFLLYVLYALPAEIHGFASGAFAKLLRLAHITNKWHFVTTEAWALSAVYKKFSRAVPELRSHIRNPLKPLLEITPFPAPGETPNNTESRLKRAMQAPFDSEMFTRMLSIAVRGDHAKLITLVAMTWSELIRQRVLPAVDALLFVDEYVSPRPLASHMNVSIARSSETMAPTENVIAHEALRVLRTIAYYSSMLSLATDFTLPSGPEGKTRRKVTQKQLDRLFAGHFAVMRKWDELCMSPPALPHGNPCTHHSSQCVNSWDAAWREASTTVAVADTTKITGRARQAMQRAVSFQWATTLQRRPTITAPGQQQARMTIGMPSAFASMGYRVDLLSKLSAADQLVRKNAEAKRKLSLACWREGLKSLRNLRKEVALWAGGIWVVPGEE